MSDRAPIEVRRLLAADVEDFRSIRLAALSRDPAAFSALHAVEAARPIGDFVERLASSVVLGAYDGPLIVGLIGFRQESSPRVSHKGFVWGFFVRPDSRRRGVGSALMAALIEVARGVVTQVTLSVVPQNTGAIALYRRFGFLAYGLEPRALKTAGGYSDEVLMALLFDDQPGGDGNIGR